MKVESPGTCSGKYELEPEHYKTHKMTCAPSEDSDQTRHTPSLIRAFAVCIKRVWVLASLQVHIEDSHQTWWMSRLIWFFTRLTGNFVGFIMLQLILLILLSFSGLTESIALLTSLREQLLESHCWNNLTKMALALTVCISNSAKRTAAWISLLKQNKDGFGFDCLH